MPKINSMADSTFGELLHVAGDLWRRNTVVLWMGKQLTVPLEIAISRRHGVEANQIAAYKIFMNQTEVVMGAAAYAVAAFFRQNYDDIRLQLEHSDLSKQLPPVCEVKDVARLVTVQSLIFPYLRPQPTFGILFPCDWEEEHGLAAKFENERVVEVGLQDIVL